MRKAGEDEFWTDLVFLSPQARACANEGELAGTERDGEGMPLLDEGCGCGLSKDGRGGEDAIERKWCKVSGHISTGLDGKSTDTERNNYKNVNDIVSSYNEHSLSLSSSLFSFPLSSFSVFWSFVFGFYLF